MEHNVLNVAIVGGGPGCKAIMDIIFAERLRQLRMKLIGVACTNPSAVGYCYAQEMGIYTTRDYRDLYKLQDLNMIIELTGREEVANEIARTKPGHVRLMDHIGAHLFWDVFQIEEERIAGLKRAEEAVRESEEKYRTLIENSLTGIFIHQDGKYVFVNDRFAEIHGYEPEELLGKEHLTLIHPDEREASRKTASKRLKGEAVLQRYEIRRLGKYRNTIWCEMMATRIEYAGRPAIMGNIIDITERRAAEEALRDSEERYRTVLEGFPDPVVVYDIEGNGLYMNPAFTRVFGWTPEELLGMKIEYVPDENWPETRMMIDKVLAGQSFSGVESRRHTKEGKTLDVSISSTIYLNRGGIPVGSVHILRDITDEKLAEEALRRAHDELEQRVEERTAELARTTEQLKMELAERKHAEEALRVAHRDLETKADALKAANEELSQYAYVVSHDLKAPLRAIHNYADFLREDLEGAVVGAEKVYLDGLNRAVRQGEELVDDLLELSRVGRRRGPIETIGIGLFLQELISSLHLSPDVEVVMGNDWPTIDTDPTLLRQILQNLISNAIKFNDSAHRRVEIGWLPVVKDRYELFVRDNGIGIDPRYHEKIFGLFQRLHTREEYAGTGLGLAIVKKATSKLHGSVRVESKRGEGSTFFVVLPKKQNEG
jgi:PAS domain S-box-containing protein